MRRSLGKAKPRVPRRDTNLESVLETGTTYSQTNVSTPLTSYEEDRDIILMHKLKAQLRELIKEKAIISLKMHELIQKLYRIVNCSN